AAAAVGPLLAGHRFAGPGSAHAPDLRRARLAADRRPGQRGRADDRDAVRRRGGVLPRLGEYRLHAADRYDDGIPGADSGHRPRGDPAAQSVDRGHGHRHGELGVDCADHLQPGPVHQPARVHRGRPRAGGGDLADLLEAPVPTSAPGPAGVGDAGRVHHGDVWSVAVVPGRGSPPAHPELGWDDQREPVVFLGSAVAGSVSRRGDSADLAGLQPGRRHLARRHRSAAAEPLMGVYAIRRLAQSVVILLGVTVIHFPLLYALSADPARMIAGRSATADAVARIRSELGLDQRLPVQYARYLPRLVRSAMLDVIHQDYVRTARAKGLGETRVILKHAMRNALLPVVSMVGLDIGTFMGGVVVVESVFSWPGIGQLAWQAIQIVDIPVIMGVVVVSALAITTGNLLADLAYPLLDPKIRYG